MHELLVDPLGAHEVEAGHLNTNRTMMTIQTCALDEVFATVEAASCPPQP